MTKKTTTAIKRSTTSLTKIKAALKAGKEPGFTWGRAIELQKIGPYSVLSFHPWKSSNGGITLDVCNPDMKAVEFYGWVNNEEVVQIWPTLEQALAGLIAYRFERRNYSQASFYFMKMILPERDEEAQQSTKGEE